MGDGKAPGSVVPEREIMSTRTYTVDAEVARLRGRLGPLTRDGRTAEVEETRTALDRRLRFLALEEAIRNAPPLEPWDRDRLAALLDGAVRNA